ncbi:hypothetical protein [Haloarcula nitratireducens]|uniref:DUF3068 domain-containing protein n=1 Tax=Haloarcula nitratireducens TaxID=2487749 RepID=A0AAW4PEJ0_9EURY|nr:hypothetical protein [Halomicroarcula nitratireducens]MBX0295677.1 hypothetical protein [Halomicroarcula nitratireducens]
MQRRAAAAYFAFFLVISVAAYAYIGVAQSQQPEVSLEGNELSNDSTFTIDGTTYTISSVQMSGGGGGGHGGGGGGSMGAELSWTNQSSRYTGTLENGSTTTLDNTTYNVTTSNSSKSVTLREQLNVTALLRNDSAVENSLVTQNGTDYVVYRENNTLHPASEWLPEPETRTYQVSQTFPYQSESGLQETTLTNVTTESATVEWVAPRNRTVQLSEGGNVTLQGQQYFAHFPDHQTVQLVSVDQYSTYQAQLADQDYFHERTNGLWGVSILSGIAAVLMLGMAYLPTRG